jgi:uroporphyrin-III C-methyltransferase
MGHLNLPLDVSQRRCLVVGGGEPAAVRTTTLLRAGAQVTVVAPGLGTTLQAEWQDGRIEWLARAFAPADCADAWLVFAATQGTEQDQTVAEAANARGRFCTLDSEPRQTRRTEASLQTPAAGEVWLIGAGPGDPGLLTVAGAQALAGADVVLHDRLVADAILDHAPATAERIFVGKERARHHYAQDDLNQLMIRLARAGRRVVRLKGGDPFIFGRGGEERAAITSAGVPCQAIPGITAGSACATYAGIPLTHRDHAQRCQFITAYGKDGATELDWAALVRPGQTLVVYMGISALHGLCPGLVEHGMSADMPAALIERGTTEEQRVLTGTVATLPAVAATHELRSPAITIIGEVVALRAAADTDTEASAPSTLGANTEPAHAETASRPRVTTSGHA